MDRINRNEWTESSGIGGQGSPEYAVGTKNDGGLLTERAKNEPLIYSRRIIETKSLKEQMDASDQKDDVFFKRVAQEAIAAVEDAAVNFNIDFLDIVRCGMVGKFKESGDVIPGGALGKIGLNIKGSNPRRILQKYLPTCEITIDNDGPSQLLWALKGPETIREKLRGKTKGKIRVGYIGLGTGIGGAFAEFDEEGNCELFTDHHISDFVGKTQEYQNGLEGVFSQPDKEEKNKLRLRDDFIGVIFKFTLKGEEYTIPIHYYEKESPEFKYWPAIRVSTILSGNEIGKIACAVEEYLNQLANPNVKNIFSSALAGEPISVRAINEKILAVGLEGKSPDEQKRLEMAKEAANQLVAFLGEAIAEVISSLYEGEQIDKQQVSGGAWSREDSDKVKRITHFVLGGSIGVHEPINKMLIKEAQRSLQRKYPSETFTIFPAKTSSKVAGMLGNALLPNKLQEEHKKRLGEAIDRDYQAIALDIDGTIRQNKMPISETLLKKLVDYVKQGGVLILATSQDAGSIEKIFFERMRAVGIRLGDDACGRIFICAENGAIVYRYSEFNKKIYEKTLSNIGDKVQDLLEIPPLKEYINGNEIAKDGIFMNKYKIEIDLNSGKFKTPAQAALFIRKLRGELTAYFESENLPFCVTASQGRIYINNKEATKMNGVTAIGGFLNIDTNHIAKIGDRLNIGGNDSSFNDVASFSVGDHSPGNPHQISVKLAMGIGGVVGTEWLLDKLIPRTSEFAQELYRDFGKTCLRFFPVGIGTIWMGRPWPEGRTYTEPTLDEIEKYLDKAFSIAVNENDIVMLDTANAYGSSEERIGQYLKNKPGALARAFIATKWGAKFDISTGKSSLDHSKENLKNSVKESLTKLGKINLLYIHGTTVGILQDKEIMSEMKRLKDEKYGGIEYIGASISNESCLEETVKKSLLKQLDVVQMPGFLFLKRLDLVREIYRQGVAIVVNSPVSKSGRNSPEGVFADLLSYKEASMILTGTSHHLDETVGYAYTHALTKLADGITGSLTALKVDVLRSQFQENKKYTISYDESISTSQEALIKFYAQILEKKSSMKIKVIKHSCANGSKKSLIEVKCEAGDRIIGEGRVDISLNEGELQDYLIRILDMVNIALAAASIPNDVTDEDLVAKYGHILAFIKSQCKAIIGRELVVIGKSQYVLKTIQNIILTLPKIYRMPIDKIEEYNRLTKQALTAA